MSPEFRFHSTVPDKNELPINSGGVIKACYGRLWPGLVIPFVGMACTWSRPDAATILPEEPGVIRYTVLRISTKVLYLIAVEVTENKSASFVLTFVVGFDRVEGVKLRSFRRHNAAFTIGEIAT
ncbi:MAG: hypothetical protein JWP08_2276, partial [Bryobacterales bacterium]|nr:hypothetical protein [Bryobacterales bacterium]